MRVPFRTRIRGEPRRFKADLHERRTGMGCNIAKDVGVRMEYSKSDRCSYSASG